MTSEESIYVARPETTFQYIVQDVRKKKGVTLISPHFCVRNLLWKIIVIPRATACSQNHLGVFLQCDGELGKPENSSWSCNATVFFKLLVQSGRRRQPFIRSIQFLFSPKGNSMGYSDFVSWSNLLDPSKGYVNQGAITLVARVIADFPNGVLSSEIQPGPSALKRPVENGWKDSSHRNKLRKVTDGEATKEVRSKTKETCDNIFGDRGMSNCVPKTTEPNCLPKTTEQSNRPNPPSVKEHTEPALPDVGPLYTAEEPVTTENVPLQTEQQPVVTEPAPGQTLEPNLSPTPEIIILTDSEDSGDKDIVPVRNQTRNTAGELQDSEHTEQPIKEARKDKEVKTDVTNLLIEKADKYFTAQKMLFTEKMLRYKLEIERLQKDKMLRNLEKEVNQIQKEIQEIVQDDKELQQQWQPSSQLAMFQKEQ